MRLNNILITLVLAVASTFAIGCGASTCENVCEQWSACVGTPSGGIEACANECDAKAEADPVYQGHVDKCWTCSEDLVCSEATKTCAIDCTIAILR